MATGEDWNCPICREDSSNIAYVGNCLHQFCHSCILRWASKNPSCPLCRQTVHNIIYPAGPNHDFVETAAPQPSVPQSAGPREEPSAAEPRAAGPQPRAHVAGLSPESWALCFRTHAEILRPVELWLEQVLCGACWWDVAFAQGRIVATLCRYGLHEEALMQELQPFLREQTVSFVRRLMEVVSEQCSEQARRCLRTARQQAEPGAAALPGTSRAQEQRPEGSEQRPEGSEQAGASAAGQSGSSDPEASGQSRGRRGGGSRDRRAAQRRQWRRHN